MEQTVKNKCSQIETLTGLKTFINLETSSTSAHWQIFFFPFGSRPSVRLRSIKDLDHFINSLKSSEAA